MMLQDRYAGMSKDLWKKDADAEVCDGEGCEVRFGLFTARKHHCRKCVLSSVFLMLSGALGSVGERKGRGDDQEEEARERRRFPFRLLLSPLSFAVFSLPFSPFWVVYW